MFRPYWRARKYACRGMTFITGRSVTAKPQLRKGEMIILEGIHGLNPELLADIKPENSFRIYVSCLTQLNLDRHNRISTTDTRMLRRILRDARDRGYSAEDTINRWEKVTAGEKEHIFPTRKTRMMFISALAYELCTLAAGGAALRQVSWHRCLLKPSVFTLPGLVPAHGTEFVPITRCCASLSAARY